MSPLSAQERVNLFVKLCMFTASITGMALISGLYPIKGNLPLIVLPSLLVLLFAKPVFFEKLKLSTLVAMRILIVFAALQLMDRQRYVNLILWMLIINILEATFTDLLRHRRYFNAVSGFAVALGVFTLSGQWVEPALGSYYAVSGALPTVTLAYVVAYTLWNWIFVTNEFSPSVALMHVGFLSAPLLGALVTCWLGPVGGLSMWLLLRANSLAIGGCMQIAAKSWFEREFTSPGFARFVAWTQGRSAQIVFMLINLALIAYCLLRGQLSLPRIF